MRLGARSSLIQVDLTSPQSAGCVVDFWRRGLRFHISKGVVEDTFVMGMPVGLYLWRKLVGNLVHSTIANILPTKFCG